MAKLYYGDNPVEADDDLHTKCVQMGFVPKGCKLGGTMLFQEYQADRDPCMTICPHEKRKGDGGCQGRVQEGKGVLVYAQVKAKKARDDAVVARGELTKLQINTLDTLIARGGKYVRK